MRQVIFIATLFALLGSSADAADITVLSPGTMMGGLKVLAAAWTAETGNKVSFVGGTTGHVIEVATGAEPGDVLVLPDGQLAGLTAKLKPGSSLKLGVAPLGLAMKAGQPKPDISTLPKFIAVLEKSGITYSDPSAGSASAQKVADMLARPDFARVKGIAAKGSAIKALLAGVAPYSGGVVSEEIGIPGVELAGRFPPGLGLDMDYSAALLSKSTAPQDAASFLRYIARPEARTAWTAGGIDPR